MVLGGKLQLMRRRNAAEVAKLADRKILTLQGWLFLVALLLTLVLGTIANLHHVLTANEPIQADVLVVEGWLTDVGLQDAIGEFRSKPYQTLITTGGALPTGYHIATYKTYAELSAATLKALGLEMDKVAIVSGKFVDHDRTFANASTLKEWLSANRPSIQSINLFTATAHARRSLLLYRKALSPEIQVGVIPVSNRDYDVAHWWRSSAGIKTVIAEFSAYVYTVVFGVAD